MVAVFFILEVNKLLSFKTIIGQNVAELTEKRSRFIATIKHVETEEEATNFINEMKAKYWDARHNVYAYILNDNNLVRFSDDGEPHGTAGKPVLDVIAGRELKNVAIVVTRYFGGILLGTGGLVRAYSSAAILAADNADISQMVECSVADINCDYSQYDKLKKLLEECGAVILDTIFENAIKISFYIDSSEFSKLNDKLIDVFFGNLSAKQINLQFFPIKIN
ncbi:MAG: YigZ family protein [Clostridia bacterium]|nr:YigZ family protein [Clostridia bacterium]